MTLSVSLIDGKFIDDNCCIIVQIFVILRYGKEIIAYENHYSDFMDALSERERLKILKAFLLFQDNQKIPSHYIDYIEDGIYEFRVTYGNNEFRIFFIYDGNTLVILFNAFRKKTQKTPRSEIEKAKRLKAKYLKEKEEEQNENV